MNGNSKLNKSKIVEVFNKMDYGAAVESTELAEKWLSSTFVKSKPSKDYYFVDVNNVLTGNVAATIEVPVELKAKLVSAQISKPFKDSLEKLKFFKEIIIELKKNLELIVQLEMCIRGFSRKDTMKSLELFFHYLNYFSTVKSNDESIFSFPLQNCSLSLMGYYIGSILCTKQCNVVVQPQEFILLKSIFELIQPQCKKYEVDLHVAPDTDSTRCAYNVKTPVLIFNDVDLDSACESIINAAWSEQGQMPWSVNTVFVQEDVLPEFTSKLKHRLNNVKIGNCNNKQVDFTLPCLIENYQSKYASLVADAKSKGIEVYQPTSNAKKNEFQPTLLIGGKVYSNKVLKPNVPNVPYVNIMGFRSIKEGVDLCNHQQQTFAATVWSDNVGLVTEIVQNLNVGTVWINTHAIFKAMVPYYLNNYNLIGHCYQRHVWNCLSSDIPNEITAQINGAKSAQVAWSKKTRDERIDVLTNVGLNLHQVLEKKGFSKDVCDDWINKLLHYPLNEQTLSRTQMYGSCELKQFNEPLGVIVSTLMEDTYMEHIISALLNGNSVIVQNSRYESTDDVIEVIQVISAQLQRGLLSCSTSKLYPSLVGYQGVYEYGANKHLPDFNFTRLKNVWTSSGENYV